MKYLTMFLILFFSVSAHALCENERNNGTTLSINACYSQEVKKSDSRILKVYSSYKNSLDAGEQKKLLELQRAWISYKMKQCDYEVMSYGTIAGQLHAQCSINMNNRRIEELNYMANCNLASSSRACMNYRPN